MHLALLNAAYSTCSQKVRFVLYEKGLPFEDRIIDLRAEEHLKAPYLALNPNGVVPTLLADGRPVIDSSVIVEFLDEMFPARPMTPADPFARADMRAWLRYVEEVPTVAIRYPSFQKVFVRHWKDLDDTAFDENAKKRPLRTEFYRKMGQAGFSEAEMRGSMAALGQTVARMEARLAAGPWLCGEDITLADACVLPTIDRMNDLGLADVWAKAPRVAAWYARIRTRPAFHATYYPGSRVSDRYADLKAPA